MTQEVRTGCRQATGRMNWWMGRIWPKKRGEAMAGNVTQPSRLIE